MATDSDDSPAEIDELIPATNTQPVQVDYVATSDDVERRLDHLLSGTYPAHSRSQWQKAIIAGEVQVNQQTVKPSHRLHAGDRVHGSLTPITVAVVEPAPIELDILYQDDYLVVVNKPAHLIVHPGKANYGGTLANALVHHFASLSQTGGDHRPGIVHRLDRDTSGVIVIARDNPTHEALSQQFAERTVEKEYEAVVWGQLEFDADRIETFVRTHSKHREKMIVCGPDPEAREAVTFYEVIQRYRGFTHVRLRPKTGRTHQLRVHMQHLRHPIVADRLYGGHPQLAVSELLESKEHLQEDRVLIARQALHARRLCFNHPHTGERLEFIAPLHDDMQQLLAALNHYSRIA